MDTRLQAEGAEFLVLGQLLTEGTEAHKAYTRYPGFDVIAFDPAGTRSCRIQVKSRWETGANGSDQELQLRHCYVRRVESQVETRHALAPDSAARHLRLRAPTADRSVQVARARDALGGGSGDVGCRHAAGPVRLAE